MPFTVQRSDGEQRYLARQYFAGAANSFGSAKRSEWVRYTADPNPGISIGQDNQRLVKAKTIYENGNVATLDFSAFDGLGHYRTVETGGTFASGNVRSSTTQFNAPTGIYTYDAESASFGGDHTYNAAGVPSSWVLDTFSFQEASEGGASARTLYAFDGNTGFLGSIRTLKNGIATGNYDTLTLRCPDARGNLASEAFYGGDVQSLGALSVSCTSQGAWQYRLAHSYSYGSLALSSYMSSASATVGFNSYKATIDASTGLPSREEDPSGYVTGFTYDGLGRLLVIEPGVGGPDAQKGAKTVYSYSGGAGITGGKVQIDVLCPTGLTCSSPSPASFGQTILVVDGFGRLIRERTTRASGSVARKRISYNVLGWKTAESETGADNDLNPGTNYGDFDPFGRPGSITPPEGAGHKIVLTYDGIEQVTRRVKIASSVSGSESDSSTTEWYDRQGRLWKVYEPAAGAANLNTVYQYDVDNRLTQVSHNTGGDPFQTRFFAYDHRGFLLSETHPEKGAGGNGTVYYKNYDARGHAREKWDGSSSRKLLFAYDKAERLTAVTEGGLGGRSIKTFSYGTTGTAKAKLSTAKRWNYYPDFGVTVLVTETYGYGGPGWRTTSRSTQLNYLGADQERFDQSFTWNRDGSLQSQTYPRCFSGGCGTGGTAARTISYRYSNGFLTDVVGYATLGYHLNGMVASVAHSNGVTVNVVNDPFLVRRPAEFQISGPGWTQSTGGYKYDGAGNVKEINTDHYVYDGVSRLVTAQMGLGGQTNTQVYAYDAVGNITSIATNGVTRLTETSSATNRLTSASYDEAGNLRSWNGQTYEYDRLNMPTRRTVGAEDWLFAYTADDERIWSYRTNLGGFVVTPRDLDGKVLRKYDAHLGWTTFTDFVYRDGGSLVASESSSGVRTAFHLDHLGTPRIATDSSGNPVRFYSYYPYGEELFPALDAQPLRFTGHERDLLSTTGTADDADYLHARASSPLLGRFLSPDKIDSGARQAPQSWNRYAYVRGNPLKFRDPDGHILDTVADIGFIAYDLYDIGRSLFHGEGSSGTQWAALGADVLGAAVPFATGLGAGVRVAAHADDAARAARGIMRSAAIGRRGEELARAAGLVPAEAVKKSIISINKTAKRRVPDGLVESTRTIYEVKNTAALGLTKQLRDYFDFAREYNYTVVLIVRNGVAMQPELEKLLAVYQKAGLVSLKFLP